MRKELLTMLANSNSQLVLEVKSKYDAEFRRFGLHRQSLNKFEEFYHLVESLHGLNGIQFNICYTDRDGDLLPINNDNNLARVLNVTTGVLRLIIQRKGECYNTGGQMYSNSYTTQNSTQYINTNTNGNTSYSNNNTSSSYRAANIITQIKSLKDLSTTFSYNQNSQKPFISLPEDFRPVSAIIDVDILPDKYRRIRLNKHKCSKPLGFYIKDGRSLRVTPQGVEQVPGVFISRLMPGGLAESTGLLSVSDEVIEVNGIEVAGKTLDQVTDMMVANSSNLIITVKPSNQRYNLNRSTNVSGSNQMMPMSQMPNSKKILQPQINSNSKSGNQNNVNTNNNNMKANSNTGVTKNSSGQSATPNKRAQTETPSVSSVNSSFSSNRASNLASSSTDKHTVDSGQINLDFSNNSGSKKDNHHHHHMDDHDHHNDIDEDDDEEIITGHSHAVVNSGLASTATSESNSPHRTNNVRQTDLNSSGDDDDNDNDNSDDKILTL